MLVLLFFLLEHPTADADQEFGGSKSTKQDAIIRHFSDARTYMKYANAHEDHIKTSKWDYVSVLRRQYSSTVRSNITIFKKQ